MVLLNECACTLKKYQLYFILDVGKEKEQKQEFGWKVSVLPIPAFHHCELSLQWNAGMGNTDTLHPNLVSILFPSLHLEQNLCYYS